MTLTKSMLLVAFATALLLLLPLVAMQFTGEVSWTLFDFVAAGVLLFGAGLTFVLIARQGGSRTYRVAVAVAVAAGLLLVWANLAVGLVGSEDNPANLLYGGVLGVAGIGALVTRFRPLGMSRAMFAAALTYVVVTAIALFIWKPAAATAEPSVGLVNVLGANAAFAALWVVAGWLFRRASTGGLPSKLPINALSLVAIALTLSAGTARAQTAGPGSIPGALPVTPADAASAGSPRAHRRTEKVPGMTHSDKKRERKMLKVPTNPEGTQKPN